MYRFLKNVNVYKKDIIPCINIEEYHKFMRFQEEKIESKWYGVSLQLFKDENISISKSSINEFHYAFETFLSSYRSAKDDWIVQPFNYNKSYTWFNSKKKFPSLRLAKLKKLFNDHKMAYSFTGALATNNEGLLNIFDDLMLYPVILKETDFELFNREKPFVVFLSQHYTIDILTTEEEIIVNFIKILKNNNFIIKRYD